MFLKDLLQSLTVGKNFKITQSYYNHCKYFPLVFIVSVSYTRRQIFVIARVFDIMQFDMLQKCFNCSYRGSTLLPTKIIESSTHWAFTCSKSAIKTL